MLQAAGIGAAVSAVLLVLLAPLHARALPDGWHVPERLAAGIVGTDRWNAGQQIGASAGPEAWSQLARASRLEEANREALDACEKDAAKAGQPERCTIQVDPPALQIPRPTRTPS